MNKIDLNNKFYVGPVSLDYTEDYLEVLDRSGFKFNSCRPGSLMLRFNCNKKSIIEGLFELYFPTGGTIFKVFGRRQGAVGFGFWEDLPLATQIHQTISIRFHEALNAEIRHMKLHSHE